MLALLKNITIEEEKEEESQELIKEDKEFVKEQLSQAPFLEKYF